MTVDVAPFDALWLGAAIRLTTPLLFTSLGEVVSERAGVLNVGLDGMILMGAFWGFWGEWVSGSIAVGVLAGLCAGVLLASVMAFVSIPLRGDQIVTGVGINLLAAGITTFSFRNIFSGSQTVLHAMHPVPVPVLSGLPGIGSALFNQIPLVYLAYLLVPVVWFVLYQTTWGMAIRSAGELPEAADTAGISVERVRWLGTLLAGAGAGLGGAMLSIGDLGFFTENMSAGRGFLALAAVIFGGWRPFGVLVTSFVFGATDALQLRLQGAAFVPRQVWLAVAVLALAWLIYIVGRRHQRVPRLGEVLVGLVCLGLGVALFVSEPHWSLPSQLWISAPYIVTLLALVGFARRTRMPSALSIPYIRGGEQ
jgi:general nucleoside transport system permease protein